MRIGAGPTLLVHLRGLFFAGEFSFEPFHLTIYPLGKEAEPIDGRGRGTGSDWNGEKGKGVTSANEGWPSGTQHIIHHIVFVNHFEPCWLLFRADCLHMTVTEGVKLIVHAIAENGANTELFIGHLDQREEVIVGIAEPNDDIEVGIILTAIGEGDECGLVNLHFPSQSLDSLGEVAAEGIVVVEISGDDTVVTNTFFAEFAQLAGNHPLEDGEETVSHLVLNGDDMDAGALFAPPVLALHDIRRGVTVEEDDPFEVGALLTHDGRQTVGLEQFAPPVEPFFGKCGISLLVVVPKQQVEAGEQEVADSHAVLNFS